MVAELRQRLNDPEHGTAHLSVALVATLPHRLLHRFRFQEVVVELHLQRRRLATHDSEQLCWQVLCQQRVGSPENELVAQRRKLGGGCFCFERLVVGAIRFHPLECTPGHQ